MTDDSKYLIATENSESDNSCRFTFIAKSGASVNVYGCNKSENPAILEKEHKKLVDKLKTGTELRKFDHRYNCHGYTFISRLGFLGIADYKKKDIILPGLSENIFDQKTAAEDIKKALSDYHKMAESPNIAIDRFAAEDVQIGDVITYLKNGDITHSCIVFQLDKFTTSALIIKVVSKMGPYGEFLHDVYDPYAVEQFGYHLQVWTHNNNF